MQRRHVTTTITMLVLIGLLLAGAVWGWKSLFAEVPDTGVVAEEPTPTCTTEQVRPGHKIRSRQVQVSVYNGGTRSGLASQTMEALMRRGFIAGEIGNAPVDVEVRAVEVWSTQRRDPQARLVARQFGRKVRVRRTDQELGPGVDVILGDGFRRLVHAPRALRVRRPERLCVPVPTESAG